MRYANSQTPHSESWIWCKGQIMSALYRSSILGSVGTRGKEVGKGDTSETSWHPKTQKSSVCRNTSPSLGSTFVTRTPNWTRPYSAILTLRNTSNALNVLLLPAALRGAGLRRMTCCGAKSAPGHLWVPYQLCEWLG